MEWEAIDHREQEDENENDMMTRRRPKKLVSASDQTLEEEDEKEEEDQQPGSSTTTTDEQEKQHSELQEDEDDDAGETFISPPPSSLSSSSPSPPSSPPPPPKRYAPLPCPVADDATRLEKPVRVYADGIYDLFHFGHARSLEQAKKSFPNTYLLVGCCSDALTNKYKGKTVMNEAERYESLRHCKWVDEVIEDAPWVITNEFLDEHQIDYVAHDSLPYADASGTGNDVYAFVKAAGKFKETKRTDGVSTSDLIMRILKDYNQYVMRNLARGYTRKDLGVSYVKEKQLQVNMRITKLRQKVKEQQERVGQRLNTVANAADLIDWVENADRWVSGFLEKFEEGCHFMESAIKSQIQKGLLMQQNQFILRSNNKLMNGRVEASRQIH